MEQETTVSHEEKRIVQEMYDAIGDSPYYSNFEDFDELFGFGSHGLKNKIFYASYLHAVKNGVDDKDRFHNVVGSVSIDSLLYGIRREQNNSQYGNRGVFEVNIPFLTGRLYSDEFRGIVNILPNNMVKCYSVKNERFEQLKFGRFLRRILKQSGLLGFFGDVACNYYIETVIKEVASNNMGDLKLVIDDDFEAIYSSDNTRNYSSLGSCETDDGNHTFYENCDIDCSAASLWDGEYMVARCVIFNDVQDMHHDESVRLAERQYASDDSYKRVLITKLIDGGHIDGYKTFNAGAGDSTAFVSNNGESWSDRKFRIYVDIEGGQAVSYQDSFKYFVIEEGYAYNHYPSVCYFEFGDVNVVFERNWDELNSEYTSDELITVYNRHGHEVSTSENFADNNLDWSDYHNSYLEDGIWSNYHDSYVMEDAYNEGLEEMRAEKAELEREKLIRQELDLIEQLAMQEEDENRHSQINIF